MKKTAVALLLAIFIQMLASVPASASSPLRTIEASSALLIEKDSGTVLYEQDVYRRHPADALAKIITLLIASQAVENDLVSDSELITMTEAAWHDIDEGNATLGIQPGQVMTFIDLMYCAFTGNADEACNMIALRLAGGIEMFVDKMNDKAAELGLIDTHFMNPYGRYHENQYTTAYDMYIIYSEALKNSLFSEIAGTFRHVTEQTEETGQRTLVSANSMLNQNSIYYYRYCLSGYTSNSFEGGYSMVAVAEEDGLTLVSVVLGAREVVNEDESVNLKHFTETFRLFTWGYSNYGWREIVKTTDLLARVPVEHGAGADFVNVRPEHSLVLLLETAISTDSFVKDITIYSESEETLLVAPVSAGDKLGEVKISRNGVVFDTIALIANTDIELNGFEFMRRQIVDILFTPMEELEAVQPELAGIAQITRTILLVVAIITVIYIALVIRYNVIRINRLRRIKNAKNELIQERSESNK